MRRPGAAPLQGRGENHAFDEGERGDRDEDVSRLCATSARAARARGEAAPSDAEELPTEAKCEFIASPGSSECMLPFPDDYYTKADPTSPTGRRIDFRELAMPRNAEVD